MILDNIEPEYNNLQSVNERRAYISEKAKQVKLIDFGLASHSNNEEWLYTKCGTPGFLAPELFASDQEVKDNTTSKLDVYAVGIMLYFMLTNEFPFDSKEFTDVYQRNKNMEVDFSNI